MLKKLKLSGSMKTHIPSRTNTKNTNKGLKCKRSQEIPGVTDKFGLGVQKEAGKRLTEFCQENTLVIANTLFQQHKRRVYTWTLPDGQYQNQIIFFAAKDEEAIYSQKKKKKDWKLTVAQIMNSFCQIQT